MLIEDLPHLSEEEREIADDGYVVMPGAPTVEPRKLRFRLARILAAIVTALALTACSLAPTQKKWAGFAAGALVVGAIAAHDADNGKAVASPDARTPTVPCSNPESCR